MNVAVILLSLCFLIPGSAMVAGELMIGTMPIGVVLVVMGGFLFVGVVVRMERASRMERVARREKNSGQS